MAATMDALIGVNMNLKPRGLQPHAWILTRAFRRVLRGLAYFKVFNVTVSNREAVPMYGAVIIACNHISVTDPVFLWGAVRRNAIALAMAELWRVPAVGQLMWLLGQIPVARGNADSGRKALETGKQVLHHDGLLFIFPEGKISKGGDLLPFKRGVYELAKASGAPVIPAGIRGSNGVKPPGSWRIHRKHHVHLEFGNPIFQGDFEGASAEHDFLEELRLSILELS
jgi:1-acyl-sn-glycerol-3-phosphate acyltransferase